MRHLRPVIYAFAIFINAALLFWLEPLFAKLVLPLLGGAPSVWNTCLVFYQVALLAGYLWAHVGQRFGFRRHMWFHVVLCAAALAVLPFAVSTSFLPPWPDAPVRWLLTVLLVSVGFPFFLLAANGPLLQRWFAESAPRGSDPYFLYAASNLGSAFALLAFPIWLERSLTLADQTRAWQWVYLANVIVLGACALAAFRAPRPVPESVEAEAVEHVSASRRARWVALAAVPSSLMLGVTTYISTEVAAIPLIWIVPLALYLGTLVLAFANVRGLDRLVHAVFTERLGSTTAFLAGGAVVAAVGLCAIVASAAGSRAAIVVAHLLVFSAAALVCHVQLARLRPQSRGLTDFYLWLGLGGALGGVFNALLGPKLFGSVLEYPLALAAVVVLLPPPSGREQRVSWRDLLWPAIVGAVGAAIPLVLRLADASLPFSPRLLLALPAAACLAFTGKPVRFGLGVAAVILASTMYPSEIGRIEHSERNFFGVHRVLRDDAAGFRWLTHGTTVHGGQRLGETDDPTPLTYYHPTGPLGDVFAEFSPPVAGVIGLGAGSMVHYGRAGQSWTFYEIDPAVVGIAQDRRYFTFLNRARPDVRIVLGDARLTLNADTGARYDMIMLDAFGSDAIPVHLLTREAVQLYLARMRPGGVLAMHLSNRFLDLAPLASALATDASLYALERIDLDHDETGGKYRSHWVVFARDSGTLAALSRREGWRTLEYRSVRVWSDDYSSVLPLFRRAGSPVP